MTPLERVGIAVMHRMDPETAHGLALKALQAGAAARPGRMTSERLR